MAKTVKFVYDKSFCVHSIYLVLHFVVGALIGRIAIILQAFCPLMVE